MKNRMRRWVSIKRKILLIYIDSDPISAQCTCDMPFRSNYTICPFNGPIENRFPQHEVAAEKKQLSHFVEAHQMGNLMENCWWKFISPHQPNWDLILIVIMLACHITLSPCWLLFEPNICFPIFTIYFRSTIIQNTIKQKILRAILNKSINWVYMFGVRHEHELLLMFSLHVARK